ncbi:hypothetical protein TRVL_02888 [Trypanosoma vivax]|uniref:BAR domain-containing protein n=1 Tax=Trypanosoma vivax (strain Y486) TaxID=1055687 RepID=G0TXC4_TRYVY|nr:hypothetical protein TRVL_02888 [Trypanosoma vivax]CCC48614.1 conserved hypothetical protein [Trypanosoma vivax Y486]
MKYFRGMSHRITQAIKEKIRRKKRSEEDDQLQDTRKRIYEYEKISKRFRSKLCRATKLLNELGQLLKEVGNEYQLVPDLNPEGAQLGRDIYFAGVEILQSAEEHRRNLKENGIDLLNHFLSGTKEVERAKNVHRKRQLEHDFYNEKVLELEAQKTKDVVRIGRNTAKLQLQRAQLWNAAEEDKAICTKLHFEGKKAIDVSVVAISRVFCNFFRDSTVRLSQRFMGTSSPGTNELILSPRPVAVALPVSFSPPPQTEKYVEEFCSPQQGFDENAFSPRTSTRESRACQTPDWTRGRKPRRASPLPPAQYHFDQRKGTPALRTRF